MMSVINSVPIIPRIGYKVKSSKDRMVSYSLRELLISSVRYKKRESIWTLFPTISGYKQE
jgi:hypothetical protein